MLVLIANKGALNGMNLLKIIILSYSLLCAVIFTQKSRADSSSISVTGLLLENTCSVDINSRSFDVELGQHDSRQFKFVGDTSESTKFNIKLISCGNAVTAAELMFSGKADDNAPELVNIEDNGGGVQGLGIQLLDKEKNKLSINKHFLVALQPGNQELTFYAQLKATDIPVVPGNIDTVVDFVLNYQ